MKKINSISDKAFKTISKKKIKPIPRWEFVIKNWLIWSLLTIAILIGSLGFSIVLFMLTSVSWELYSMSQETCLQKLIIGLPYFWILTTIAFVVLAYLIWRKTKRSYRYNLLKVVIAEVLVSLLIGGMMFQMGIGNKVDEIFARDIPFYRTLVPHMLEVWINPDEGMLAGEIIVIESETQFRLKDFEGKIWTVQMNNTLIRGRVVLRKGEQIKMVGQKIEKEVFVTSDIRPWIGPGMMRRFEQIK